MCHFHKYKNLQVITKCHNLYYKMHSYYRMLWNIPLSAVSQNIIALVCFFFGALAGENRKRARAAVKFCRSFHDIWAHMPGCNYPKSSK